MVHNIFGVFLGVCLVLAAAGAVYQIWARRTGRDDGRW
jgi:hypothetical protein